MATTTKKRSRTMQRVIVLMPPDAVKKLDALLAKRQKLQPTASRNDLIREAVIAYLARQ